MKGRSENSARGAHGACKDTGSFEDVIQKIKVHSEVTESLLIEFVSDYIQEENFLKIVTHAVPDIGLRVRPFLVRMGYEATGKSISESILRVGAAIELMQLSTLVIDDILDKAPTRNNRPTVFKKYGVDDAVLIGASLKSMATLCLIREIEKMNVNKKEDALRILDQAFLDVNIGQFLDLEYEKKTFVEEQEYLKMIEKTTAKFIEISVKIGAILGEASERILHCVGSYGHFLGLAYQIRDDVIDIIGEEQLIGKKPWGDIRFAKKRLPLVHLLSLAKDSERRILLEMIRKPPLTHSSIEKIIHLMKQKRSILYAKKKAKRYCQRAIAALKPIRPFGNEKDFVQLSELVGSF